MNTARIVVLAIAVCAGGVAAYLASGSEPKQAAVPAPVPQMKTTDVLVAKSDIALGQVVKPEDMQWQAWPATTASASFIRRNDRADALSRSRDDRRSI